MKDFFGWFLVVTRRSSHFPEASRTERGIYGVSMIMMLYTLGILLSTVVVLSQFRMLEFIRQFNGFGQFGGGIVVGSGVLSIILLKYTYKQDVIEYYIEKYKPADDIEDKKQRKLAFLFVLGGFLALGSPFILSWLLS